MSPTGPNKFQRGMIDERIQKSNSFCIMTNYKFMPKFDVNILKDGRGKSSQMGITGVQLGQKSNLICITQKQIKLSIY